MTIDEILLQPGKKRVIYSAVAFLIATYAVSNPSVAENPSWVADEALTQLHELQTELTRLRGEVTALRAEVRRLQSGGGATTPIEIGNAPTLGSVDAGVAVVEFSDYQCPFCVRYQRRTFPRLKREYVDAGKVLYVARDFPLGLHADARQAAVATHCAGDQGAFWAMRRRLFARAGQVGRDALLEDAGDLKLDVGQFTRCLASGKNTALVDDGLAQGVGVGVRGTPAFLIGTIENGVLKDYRLVSGAQAYPRFAAAIDGYLAQGVSDGGLTADSGR